jgi:hypothetical protein
MSSVRRTIGAGVVGFVLVGSAMGVTAIDAGAKGMPFLRVRIEGPGISTPIRVGEPALGASTDLWALAELSGYNDLIYSDHSPKLLPSVPSQDLGPRYVVTYMEAIGLRDGGMRRFRIVQHLYPLATPRPLAYMPAGQRYPYGVSQGRWFVADDGLVRELERLGVHPTLPTETTLTDVASRSFALPLVVLAAGVVALLGVLLALIARTRRYRARPSTA